MGEGTGGGGECALHVSTNEAAFSRPTLFDSLDPQSPTHRSNIERNLSARSPAAPARAPGCDGVIVFPVSVVWWLESPPSVVFSHGFVGGLGRTDLRSLKAIWIRQRRREGGVLLLRQLHSNGQSTPRTLTAKVGKCICLKSCTILPYLAYFESVPCRRHCSFRHPESELYLSAGNNLNGSRGGGRIPTTFPGLGRRTREVRVEEFGRVCEDLPASFQKGG